MPSKDPEKVKATAARYRERNREAIKARKKAAYQSTERLPPQADHRPLPIAWRPLRRGSVAQGPGENQAGQERPRCLARGVPPPVDLQGPVEPQTSGGHRPLVSFVPALSRLRGNQRRVDALGSAVGVRLWHGPRSRPLRRDQYPGRRLEDSRGGARRETKRSGRQCKTSH